MEDNFNAIWSRVCSRYLLTSHKRDALFHTHSSLSHPFEERLPGHCRRLYYIPHCKVLESFETERANGEKLGVNRRDDCWFYERWRGRGEGRVFRRAWKRSGKQWGDVTTTLRDGHKVSYWKEDGQYRCFSEYEKTQKGEVMKKAECRREVTGTSHLYFESISRTAAGETGQKLRIAYGEAEKTTWEVAKCPYTPSCDIDIDFTDLRKKTEVEIPATSEPHMDPATSEPHMNSTDFAENFAKRERKFIQNCLDLLQERGLSYSACSDLEEILTRPVADDYKSLLSLLRDANKCQTRLVAALVGEVTALKMEAMARDSQLKHEPFRIQPINMKLIGSFSPVENPYRGSFVSSDVSDSNPFSARDDIPVSADRHSLSPSSTPASGSTSVSIGAMKAIPRMKINSAFARIRRIHTNFAKAHLQRFLTLWKACANELSSSLLLHDTSDDLNSTPRASIWNTDQSLSIDHSLEVMVSRSVIASLPEHIAEFEGIIKEEMDFLLERCHLKQHFHYKGERYLKSIGAEAFTLFEDLMDKKYLEIIAAGRSNKPVKSLSQFFCEELLPGRSYTKEQLRTFGRFMVTVMRMNHDENPYGQFICRLLRIDHPRPIFDNCGKLITQFRYEVLQTLQSHSSLSQFSELISIREAFRIAQKTFQCDEVCLSKWLSCLKFESLTEVQTAVYWISLILEMDEVKTGFSEVFPQSPASFYTFSCLPLHGTINESTLQQVFDFYCETKGGLTVEAWDRMLTDGDFLQLPNSALPLQVMLEAIEEAFHDLQVRIAASVAAQYRNRPAVTLFGLNEVLRAVLPGLKPTVANDIFQTAVEISGGNVDSVPSKSVTRAIFRLKLEIR